MIIDDRVQKFLSESQKYSFMSHHVPFDRVMMIHCAELEYLPSKRFSWGHIFKNFLKRYDMAKLLDAFRQHRHIFTIIVKRDDHKASLSAIADSVPDSQLVELFGMIRPDLRPHPLIFIRTFLRTWHASRGKHGLRGFMFLWSRLFLYQVLAKDLGHTFRQVDCTEKSFMPVNSSTYEDVVFTEFFKRKGCRTYHFCHGQHFVDYHIAPFFDVVNALNVTADNIIVWGESSVQDIRKNFPQFSGKKVSVGGNPRMPEKEIKVRQKCSNCFVLLGSLEHSRENLGLLELLHEYQEKKGGMSFSIKPHPSNFSDEIRKRCSDYGFTLLDKTKIVANLLTGDQYDCAMSIQTNAYYEALYNGLPCFRYAVGENPVQGGLDDKFTTVEELASRIDHFRNCDPQKLREDIIFVLKHYMGMGINNYKQIILSDEK